MKRLSKSLKRQQRRARSKSAGIYGPQCLEDRSLMAGIHANPDGFQLVTFTDIGNTGSQDVFARLKSPSSTSEVTQRVNVTTAGIQGNEAAALGADGHFVVVWSGRGEGDSQGVFARVFNPDGTTSGEIRVSEMVAGEQDSPAVAMDAQGRFVVAWSGPGVNDRHGIFVRAFNRDGTPRGASQLINSNTSLLQRDPSIGMNGEGDFLVAWESLGEDEAGWGIEARRFDENAAAAAAQFKVNTTTNNQQLGAAAAMAGDGSAIVAFASQITGNTWEVRERGFNSAGAASGNDTPVTTSALGGRPTLDLIADGADRHVVTWAWGARSGNGAGIFGREIVPGDVSDPPAPFLVSSDAGRHVSPSVAVDPQGDLLFAWSGSREPISTGAREADRDRTLPVLTATLSSPVANGTVETVTLDASLADVNAVTRLQVRLDGQAFKDLLTGADLRDDDFEITSAQLATALGAALPSGLHTLGLQATDDAGNLSTIVNVQFTLDAAPQITALGLVTDTGTQEGITTTPDLKGTIDDFGPVTKLQARVNGRAFQDINTSTTDHRGEFTINEATLKTLLGLAANATIPDGQYTVGVQATDASGDVSTIREFTFTLDRAAPTIVQPLNDLSTFEDDPTLPLNVSGAFSGGGLVFTVENSAPNVLRTEVQGNIVNIDYLENRNGQAQIKVRATKPNGLFVEDTFVLDVIPAADAPTTVNELADLTLPNVTGQTTSINLGGVFGDADELGTLVRFDLANNLGSFGLELFNTSTSQTVQNFLSYVNSGRYADTILHRNVPGFIVQGGGYTFEGTNTFADVDRQQEVVNEPGISNRRGTIAMAKLGGQPNSATSEFFFNLGDNNSLAAPDSLDNQNGGFTAFGRVLGNGMSLIDGISNLAPRDLTQRTDIVGNRQVENPFNSGNFETRTIREVLSDIPLNTFTDLDEAMKAPVTAEDVVRFLNVAVDPTLSGGKGGDNGLTISVNSSNTSIVTAALNNKRLTLDPVANGTATITVTATDATNRTVSQTFTVTVVVPSAGMVTSIPSLTDPAWQTIKQASDGNLRILDVVRGTGEAVDAGDRISVHYSGWLASNGNQFDSSIPRGEQPITFSLNGVIQGWKDAIPGMREGGIRRLDIPASLAYGSAGQGSIPPNARLVFEVKVLDVPAAPLMLAGGEETAIPSAEEITSFNPRAVSPEIKALVQAAVERLNSAGLERQVATSLGDINVQMADLPGSLLGLALADQIWLDADAAGQGWFFDASPSDDAEFVSSIAGLVADNADAANRVDLLSVIAHELGHVMGLGDETGSNGLMSEALGPGQRRI